MHKRLAYEPLQRRVDPAPVRTIAARRRSSSCDVCRCDAAGLLRNSLTVWSVRARVQAGHRTTSEAAQPDEYAAHTSLDGWVAPTLAAMASTTSVSVKGGPHRFAVCRGATT